ncbi:MAG: protein translocase subunit SecF [Chloroflexota bacterium]|nr:protein translocase subunit SecF [Chloroflexota bacterium]
MLDLVGKKYWFLGLSLLVIIPGLFFLLLGGLRAGIDFTGGSSWELKFDKTRTPNLTEVQNTLVEADAKFLTELKAKASLTKPEQDLVNLRNSQKFETIAQPSDNGLMIVRTGEIKLDTDEKAALIKALEDRFKESNGFNSDVSITTTGPTVASEVTLRSFFAVLLASAGILLYLAWAFRKVKEPWRYGICAVVAVLHDVLVVVGVFAILGKLFGIEIDSLFITALLTVIGFSVHDTIVVFDRIRENQIRYPGEKFASTVNYSLVQTLARSLNTSLTVIFTLSALYLFGGVTIRNFVLALLVGIISGTYSSIFNASMMLVIWNEFEEKQNEAKKSLPSRQPQQVR